MRLIDPASVPSFLRDRYFSVLEVRPQFPPQDLVVTQTNQDGATLDRAFQDRATLVVTVVLVGQRGDDRHDERPVLLVADGESITAAVHVEQLAVAAEPVLALPRQHILEDDLALELGFLAAGEIDLLDLLVDVPFFIGQEEIAVSAAG